MLAAPNLMGKKTQTCCLDHLLPIYDSVAFSKNENIRSRARRILSPVQIDWTDVVGIYRCLAAL